jgi:hypothetical protein
MDIMFALQLIAFIGLITLPYAIYLAWRTTDAIFYIMLMTLTCIGCGFITLIGVYSWITYIR